MNLNETLLTFRQNLIKLFKKHENVILPLLKFIVLFLAVQSMMVHFGYNGVLKNVFFMLFLALVGTFLPAKWLDLAGVILVPMLLFDVNIILAVVAFVFLWVLYLLYMRLYPKEALLIGVTFIAFMFKVEVILPFIVALFGSYICIISIIVGIVLWYVTPELSVVMQSQGVNKEEILEVFTNVTNTDYTSFLKNETMLCMIIVCFIVFSIVYIVRKQSIDYAAYIAIGIGATMSVVGFGMAVLFFEGADIHFVQVIIMSIVAVVISSIMQFFSNVLDYQRAEQVTFEDEENYYYVRVVPKIYLNTSHKKVKRVYKETSKKEHEIYSDNDEQPPFSPNIFE